MLRCARARTLARMRKLTVVMYTHVMVNSLQVEHDHDRGGNITPRATTLVKARKLTAVIDQPARHREPPAGGTRQGRNLTLRARILVRTRKRTVVIYMHVMVNSVEVEHDRGG